MNRTDAAKLLTVAAGFDRRQVTEVTATAWAAALHGYDYSECEKAIIAHHRDPATRGQYLTVGHVLDRVESWGRNRTGDIEADVRSAKARGMVSSDWPDRDPLPESVAERLAAARMRERQEAERYSAITDGVSA